MFPAVAYHPRTWRAAPHGQARRDVSEAKPPSAHEAAPAKRAESVAQPAPLEKGMAGPESGVILLERGAAAAPPVLPGEPLRRVPTAARGLGPTPISYLLHVQRRHGNRQMSNALASRRALEPAGQPDLESETEPTEDQRVGSVETGTRFAGARPEPPPDGEQPNSQNGTVNRLTVLRVLGAPAGPGANGRHRGNGTNGTNGAHGGNGT